MKLLRHTLVCLFVFCVLSMAVVFYDYSNIRGERHVHVAELEVVPLENTTTAAAARFVPEFVPWKLGDGRDDGARGRSNHSCGYIESLASKTRSPSCALVMEHMRRCHNGTAIGRDPLPNFFLAQNRSRRALIHGDYKNANLAFVHLPKAGGTSVESVLKKIPGLKMGINKIRKYPISHCKSMYSSAITLSKTREQTYLYSKRTFGVHHYAYPRRPFAYVTWFREPISRLLSTYYYLKKTRCAHGHVICKQYLLTSRNLTDYLLRTTDVRYQDMDNFNVRLLQFGDFPNVDDTFEDGFGGVALKDADTIPKIEEKHYLAARHNLLTKMAFVGLTEDFKTSQDMLCHVFGVRPAKNETHLNANKHDLNITDFELAELGRRNRWDLKLYEDAKMIYNQQKKIYLDMKN